jgi:hypothetical protein
MLSQNKEITIHGNITMRSLFSGASMDKIIAEIQTMKNCTCTDCGSGVYSDQYINIAVAVVPSINDTFRSSRVK